MAAFVEKQKRYKAGPARRRKAERAKYRRRNRNAPRGKQLGLELVVRAKGGKRKGAGRKRHGELRHVPHRRRRDIYWTDAIHVTWRVLPHVWNLRSQRCFLVLKAAFAAACERLGARLISYSVQGNHLHLVFEADSDRALSRALNGLGTRIARGLNKVMGTKGAVLDGRYHARPLRTGTEVRNVLGYLADNARRHFETARHQVAGVFGDIYTCLGRLDFRQHRPWKARALGPEVVAEPRTALLLYRWQLA
jgi:REP element-mobilizing transposase RayT